MNVSLVTPSFSSASYHSSATQKNLGDAHHDHSTFVNNWVILDSPGFFGVFFF